MRKLGLPRAPSEKKWGANPPSPLPPPTLYGNNQLHFHYVSGLRLHRQEKSESIKKKRRENVLPFYNTPATSLDTHFITRALYKYQESLFAGWSFFIVTNASAGRTAQIKTFIILAVLRRSMLRVARPKSVALQLGSTKTRQPWASCWRQCMI